MLSFAAMRSNVEKTLFGITFDELFGKIRAMNRTVDALSNRLDENIAMFKKDLRVLENGGPDPRDGLYIIESDCISCQICTDIAPATFTMREDGIAQVTDAYATDMNTVYAAISNCSGSCIKMA